MGNTFKLTQLIFTNTVELIQQYESLTLDSLFDHLLPTIPSVMPEFTTERLLAEKEQVIKALEVMAIFSIPRDYPDYEYDAATRTIRRHNPKILGADLDWKQVHDKQYSSEY